MSTTKSIIYGLSLCLTFCNVNGQSISTATFNSIGTSMGNSSGNIDMNIGESVTGFISSSNNQITQGLLQPNNFSISLKIILEGFYTGNGLMNNYGAGGCLYKLGISPNPNDVDTVRLALADRITHEVIETTYAILQIDGSANFNFHSATEGLYYLKLTHRNSVQTWSASPVLLTNDGVYDFTTSSNKSFGNNEVVTFDNMGWAMYSGDISDATTNTLGRQDGIVQQKDYQDMESAIYLTKLGYVPEDITGDGIVESFDYVLVENNVSYSILVINP